MGALKLRVLSSPLRVSALVGVVAFGAGTGVGYLLGQRKKSTSPHQVPADLGLDLTPEDLDLIRARNAAKRRKGTVVIPAKPDVRDGTVTLVGKEFLQKKLQEVEGRSEEPEPVADVRDLSSVPMEPEEPYSDRDVELVTHSVFTEADPNWDYNAELARRNAANPYVIHKDEFFENEFDYTQVTVTYYEGDDIMADDADTPIYNHAGVFGELKWGHGSGDPNVVYIRNDKRKTEYEVLRETGLFSEVVEGLTIEDNHRKRDLQHSSTPRKFRQE